MGFFPLKHMLLGRQTGPVRAAVQRETVRVLRRRQADKFEALSGYRTAVNSAWLQLGRDADRR
jgi:hypothetical protein